MVIGQNSIRATIGGKVWCQHPRKPKLKELRNTVEQWEDPQSAIGASINLLVTKCYNTVKLLGVL